ncbi:MAG: cellulase family glycosylhydrolase [Candidatus Symbiothrix sp.]|jgi:mannan endo-1,4-beta-mannosidase|nr:cellulase family glycosylhydrolase [Candidatus Symbiothrix sp.]
MKHFVLFCSLVIAICNQTKPASAQTFVKVSNTQLTVGEQAYYFVGTNFWYGAILGSTGQGGNRERLAKELDLMQSVGITNLRVLVGAEGFAQYEKRVRPTLQPEPGVYNDSLFDGLDYFLNELGKRKMYAVLYLNNTWDWSGGFNQYLEWTGRPPMPEEANNNWRMYCEYAAQYATCEACKELFFNHIRAVLGRTNRYSGLPYSDDPAIMAWQVCNEPRAFSRAAKAPFAQWLRETTALIRSLDANHLISLGSEGVIGCELDTALFETIHSDPNVDYITMHIWPKNWNWIDSKNVVGTLDAGIAATDKYIEQHLHFARKLNKPLVIEEFGYPRDNHLFVLDDPTTARDRYYAHILQRVRQSASENDVLAGSNFWAWGGYARPAHEWWQPWDDYTGDPAQEEQGLNAVFDTDSTMIIIKNHRINHDSVVLSFHN